MKGSYVNMWPTVKWWLESVAIFQVLVIVKRRIEIRRVLDNNLEFVRLNPFGCQGW
ncbi:MAG: hypothetical protein QXI12_06735 [Candidatus Methanomethyliaceae archaeon]